MHKRSVRVTLAALAAVPLALSLTTPATAVAVVSVVPVEKATGTVVPGSYVVRLADNATTDAVLTRLGVQPDFTYKAVIFGFAAHLSAAQLTVLQSLPGVVSIEPDQVFTADSTQAGATWGLDRIDQRNLPLSATYTYTATASSVTAYVIDTGIATSHPDFGGRAAASYDAFGGTGQDCNGHGTHVAGTIGGTTYGVAKAVRLRAVRVLDCAGSGSTSGIIAGMDWVRLYGARPAVANMSLGGSYSSSLNTAATNLANSGVFLAVAAGNEAQDACNVSPASASGTLTVAASDSTDTRASFSNYGGCVDTYAPGVSITSDWLNGGTNTISGTSMASPHAAGVGALYKANFGDAASSTIVSWVTSNATSGVIKSNVTGTPNRLLYKSTL